MQRSVPELQLEGLVEEGSRELPCTVVVWPGTVRGLPARCLFLGLDVSKVSSFSRYSDSW